MIEKICLALIIIQAYRWRTDLYYDCIASDIFFYKNRMAVRGIELKILPDRRFGFYAKDICIECGPVRARTLLRKINSGEWDLPYLRSLK